MWGVGGVSGGHKSEKFKKANRRFWPILGFDATITLTLTLFKVPVKVPCWLKVPVRCQRSVVGR